MKIIKARYDLLFFFFFPFCLLTILLYLFSFKEVASFAMGNWLCMALLLVLIILPSARMTLGESLPTKKSVFDVPWILRLFLSQLLMNLTVWSFAKIMSLDLSNRVQISVDINHLSLSAGIFPWGYMVLFSITLGYFIYRNKQLGLLSSAFTPLYKNSHTDSIGIAVDSYMRFIPTCVIALILSLLAFSCMLLLQKWLGFNLVTGLKFQVFFVSCLLLMTTSYPASIKFVHQLMYKRVPTAVILIGFALLVGVLYPIFDQVANFLVYINPLLDIDFANLDLPNRAEHIVIAVTFWWYALSTMTGAYLTYISQEKTFKQLVIFSLITFLLSLGIMQLLDKTYGYLNGNSVLPLVVMGICCVAISLILLNKHLVTYFFRATLPTDVPIKSRSNFRLLKITPLVVVSLLCTFLGLGVSIWSFLLVLGFLPPLMIIYISFIALSKNMFQCER